MYNLGDMIELITKVDSRDEYSVVVGAVTDEMKQSGKGIVSCWYDSDLQTWVTVYKHEPVREKIMRAMKRAGIKSSIMTDLEKKLNKLKKNKVKYK